MSPHPHVRRAVAGTFIAVAAAAGLLAQSSTAHAGTPVTSVKTSSSSLTLGPPSQLLPATAKTPLIAVLSTGQDADIAVQIVNSGRYTVNYRNLLPSVVTTAVDGTALQPTTLSYYDSQYTQTFFLTAGRHVIHVGGSQVDAALDAFLDGTL